MRGTLDLMILRTLEALGPLHGYAIAARLEQVSRGALVPNMGTLYPGLMRLEQRGLIKATWDVTENNRNARYYEITAAGRRALASEKNEWDRMVAIMHALFGDA
ncbi:MAG TPA: PadR family transcriptional regulator [Gammaproteobacteria bacterium]|nr:PadR family transcriptional regulator [Gammaproteobacteria bacterium]